MEYTVLKHTDRYDMLEKNIGEVRGHRVGNPKKTMGNEQISLRAMF